MRKIHVLLTLAGMLSSIFNLPGFAREGVFDLNELYHLYPSAFAGSTEGNFIQATDGTVLFFHPSLKDKLRKLLSHEQDSFSAPFLVFTGKNGRGVIQNLVVSEKLTTLQLSKWSAKQSEVDRLQLAPEFLVLNRYCESLFPGQGRFRSGLINSSFLRLHDSIFLISGGGCADPTRYSTEAETVPTLATVFDVKKGKVLKSFSLQQKHSLHSSLLLSDGRVLLIGGRAPLAVEIVDVKAGKSRLLTSKSEEWRSFFTSTVCLDHTGKCIVLGSIPEAKQPTKLVYKIDLSADRIKRLPDLAVPRGYVIDGKSFRVYQNALALPSGEILVSEGFDRVGSPMNYHRRTDFEVYSHHK